MPSLPFILVALTYLAAIGFYNPMGVLPGSMIKMLFCAFSLLALVLGCLLRKKTARYLLSESLLLGHCLVYVILGVYGIGFPRPAVKDKYNRHHALCVQLHAVLDDDEA